MFGLCCATPKVVQLVNDVSAKFRLPSYSFALVSRSRQRLIRSDGPRPFVQQLTAPHNKGLERQRVAQLVSLVNSEPKECERVPAPWRICLKGVRSCSAAPTVHARVHGLRLSPRFDWAARRNGKHAAKALVTKLDDWSPLTQLLALMVRTALCPARRPARSFARLNCLPRLLRPQLLEAMMKECTLTFFDILAARNIPQLLSTLALRYGVRARGSTLQSGRQ